MLQMATAVSLLPVVVGNKVSQGGQYSKSIEEELGAACGEPAGVV